MVRRVFVCILFGIAALALGCILWLNRVLSPEQLKPRLEAQVSGYLGRRFTLEGVGWTLRPVPLLIARNARIYDARHQVTAECPQVKLYLDYQELSRGRLFITDLQLQDIRISLPLGRKKPVDFVQMVYQIATRPSAKAGVIALKQLSIHRGHVNLTIPAHGMKEERLAIELEGLLRLGSPSRLRATLSVSSPMATVGLEIPDMKDIRCHAKILSHNSELLDLVSSLHRLKSVVTEFKPVDSTPASRFGWHLEGEFRGRNLTFRSFPVQSLRTRFQMSAGHRRPIKGTFEMEAAKLVWNEQVRFETVRTSGTLEDGRWRAEISAADGTIQKAAVQSMSLTYRQEAAGRFEVKPLLLRGMHGTIEAQGRVSPSEIDLAWAGRDLDVSELGELLRQKIPMTGTVNTTGWLRGDRMPWPNRSLEGAVEIQVKNGISIGIPGLLETLSALNIETLLKKKRNGQEGIPFDTFEATGTIHAGVLRVTKPMLFTNDTLEIAFLGSVDWVDKQIDGQIVVTFLTVVDEFVRLIPGVRTVLHDGQKSIVPMIVTIHGPLDNPSTKAKRLEGAAATAWKSLGGALRASQRIIDSVTPGRR